MRVGFVLRSAEIKPLFFDLFKSPYVYLSFLNDILYIFISGLTYMFVPAAPSQSRYARPLLSIIYQEEHY